MTKNALDQFKGMNSLQQALRSLTANSAINQIMKQANDQRALLRMVEGPFADLKRAGVLDGKIGLSQELNHMMKLASQARTQFQLPQISEQLKLFSRFQTSPAFEALKAHQGSFAGIKQAMKAMRSPWMDAQDNLKSIHGFAQLQIIGDTLNRHTSFGDIASTALRRSLGDWRDPITWPEAIFTDYDARSKFYVNRGFDPDLTNFPSEAFEESLEIANLQGNPPSLIKRYGQPVSTSDNQEDEDGYLRTNTAHDWLARMETQIRRFIDHLMTKQFGDDWPKQKLPDGLYDKWHEKREKAQKAGRLPYPLISYADFTDYELIICRRGNWTEVFSGFFLRPEFVRESFQRLYPVRIDIMHARLITQDDELFLYVEIRRLTKVIESSHE